MLKEEAIPVQADFQIRPNGNNGKEICIIDIIFFCRSLMARIITCIMIISFLTVSSAVMLNNGKEICIIDIIFLLYVSYGKYNYVYYGNFFPYSYKDAKKTF